MQIHNVSLREKEGPTLGATKKVGRKKLKNTCIKTGHHGFYRIAIIQLKCETFISMFLYFVGCMQINVIRQDIGNTLTPGNTYKSHCVMRF